MDGHMEKVRRLLVLTLAAVLLVACTKSPAQDLSARLTSEARNLVHVYDLPGITVAIASPDGVISIAAGRADREHDRAMSPETTMLAASIGKTFVAATVLQLCDEGRLDLDDPISKWLERWDWFADLPNADTIRVRHLLQHTSGLPDHVHMDAFAQLGLNRAAELGPEGMVALVLGTEPRFPAGAGWSYTDTGYLLLGLIIEAETGRAFLSGGLLEPETFAQAIDGVVASDGDAMSFYGLGIAIRQESNWGTLYGHRGWIPGYVSSLQYYPDYDTAIAFQTNTDIGIIDSKDPVIMVIEERLAAVIFGE